MVSLAGGQNMTFDIFYAGIAPWTPEGMHDVEWTLREGKEFTRVHPAPDVDHDMQHCGTGGAGGTVINYNTWFTQVVAFVNIVNITNTTVNITNTTINNSYVTNNYSYVTNNYITNVTQNYSSTTINNYYGLLNFYAVPNFYVCINFVEDTVSLGNANINNYAISDYPWQRWSSGATISITGIVAPVGHRSCWHMVTNVGSNLIRFPNQSASSTAANRFLINDGNDYILRPGQTIFIIYDPVTLGWRPEIYGPIGYGTHTYIPVWQAGTDTGPDGSSNLRNSTITDDATTAKHTKRMAVSPRTVTTLTADTNNLDVGDAVFIRLSGDDPWHITGIANGTASRVLLLCNVGNVDLTLDDENAGSSASNRIITGTGADFVLNPDALVLSLWDGTDQRWRLHMIGSGGGGPPNFDNCINFVSDTVFLDSGTANNYEISDYPWQRWSSSGGATITGIVAPVGHSCWIMVTNVGTTNITFPNQSGGSDAANRFLVNDGNDYVLRPDQTVFIIYDPITARWRPEIYGPIGYGTHTYIPVWQAGTDTGADGSSNLRNSTITDDATTAKHTKRMAVSPATPTTLSADTNNLDVGDAVFIRLSGDDPWHITGIANGTASRVLVLCNVGNVDLTLDDENASSSASNRIITGTGADFVLDPDAMVLSLWDGTDQRWRLHMIGSGGGGGGGAKITAVRVYLTNGTWSKPASLHSVIVLVQAGGGGSGGVIGNGLGTSFGASGGGGGGACAWGWIPAADLGATEDYLVGVGGAGGNASTPTNGGDGDPSSFGTAGLVSASSGTGAATVTGSATVGNVGTGGNGGGSGTGGFGYVMSGGDGGNGISIYAVTNPYGFGGMGGGSHMGSSHLVNGGQFGGGGGGVMAVPAAGSVNGIAGVPGIIVVIEFST